MARPWNVHVLTVLVVTAWRAAGAASLQQKLQAAMQGVADEMQAKYDMGIAAALYAPRLQVDQAVASGFADEGYGMGSRSRKVLPDDVFVWGSTTKMFTAPAVLQLVENGAVGLDDPVVDHVDSLLHELGGRTLHDHFNGTADGVLIRHLLHMTSGIPDYDDGHYSESQFANSTRDVSPVEILRHFLKRRLDFTPGASQSYSSTNYILLGMVLVAHHHRTGDPWDWQDFNQLAVIPEALRRHFVNSTFVKAGPCKRYSPVHGYLEAYITAPALRPQDVWNVSCLGGWTAGNYVGPVRDVARFTHDLYNKAEPRIVSASSQALLTNFSAPGPFGKLFKFYGMGTFSLDWSVGNAEAYGHVGDTYGYQSQTTYFPGSDFVLTVATNVETFSQAQPADFTCLAYHAVLDVLNGARPKTCNFTVPRRFIGKCTCEGDASQAIVV